MIVLNVTYRCRPGMRDAFLAAIRAEGIDEKSRAEAGNLKYDYYLPIDGGDLLLIEHWRDAEALEAHAKQPHYLRLRELKPTYVTDTLVETFVRPETENQTVTVTIRTSGEPCELSDEQITAWYEERIASLFDPNVGKPEITVALRRERV